ncbi:MAG: hypothetical protein KGI14_09305, partial [Acidobacteriota bacterium]|nr:hypothetical protein [Acidobacteriota bacterium]
AVKATTTLNAPSISSTASTSKGVATVSYSGSSNAPSGQTYLVTLCTNSLMTIGCTNVNPYSSGASVSGLTSGVTYYVTVTANASAGYLSATSTVKSVNVS